jgi:DNA topoisomerase-1
MELFKLPREIGMYESELLTIGIGLFGAYVKHAGKFYSLKKEDDPLTVTEERAVELIEEKRAQEKNKFILVFEAEGIEVCNGRFGPYIAFDGKNYKIPKGTEPTTLSVEACKEIIEKQGEKGKTKSTRSRKK